MKPIYFDKDERIGGGYVNQKQMAAVEKELLYNYRKVLDKITADIEKLARKIGEDGVIEYSEMAKYNRLSNLQKEIADQISTLVKGNDKLSRKFTQQSLESSYMTLSHQITHAVARGAGIAVKYDFGMIDPNVIKASVFNPLYLASIEDIKTSTIVQIKREITQGLISGESYFAIAKRIKERMDVSASRARTIARTEAGKAWSAGHEIAHERAEELGIEVHKVWMATLDVRTRDTHRSMDQQVADNDGYFKLPGGILVRGPRLGGPAKEVVNCRCRMVTVVEGFEPTERMSREGSFRKKSEPLVPYQSYVDWQKSKDAGILKTADFSKSVNLKHFKSKDAETITKTLRLIKGEYKNFPVLDEVNSINTGKSKFNAYASLRGDCSINIGTESREIFTINNLEFKMEYLKSFPESDEIKIALKKYERTIKSMRNRTYDYYDLHSACAFDDPMEAIIRHESGHILYYKNQKLIDKFFDDAYNRGMDWKTAYGVTSRAKDDMHECIAENFTLYSAGKFEYLHPDIISLFKELSK